MKEYIKPTFITAGLFPVALAVSGGCTSTELDLEILRDIIADKTAFAEGEVDCTNPCEYEEYCKYTAMEAGKTKVLSS